MHERYKRIYKINVLPLKVTNICYFMTFCSKMSWKGMAGTFKPYFGSVFGFPVKTAEIKQ